MQGTAAAYDMARFGFASEILLLDRDLHLAQASTRRVNRLAGAKVAHAGAVDVGDLAALSRRLSGFHACLSAVPYPFNPGVTRAAIQAGTNCCDLGGNTAIVLQQHRLDGEAKKAGITVIPDCGLMPGMGNTLAVYALEKMDRGKEVFIRCGGLPQKPRPPLDYKLVFSIYGLLNEYFGKAVVLRNGRPTKIDTFTELEAIEFPSPVGRCEAFVTSGGTSTCPWSYQGILKTYEYKTVRYPGHYQKFKTLLDLGLLEEKPLPLNGRPVSPREIAARAIAPRIDLPGDRDLVVLRVICTGEKSEKNIALTLDLMDFHDEKTGFSAMERTTGFPASIVAIRLARGECPKGVVPLEKGIPGSWFVKELLRRKISIIETVRAPL